MNYKCPLGFNAAEYYVSLLGIQNDRESESRNRIRNICDEYRRSSIATAIEKRIKIYDEIDTDDESTYNEKVVIIKLLRNVFYVNRENNNISNIKLLFQDELFERYLKL